MSTTYVRKKWHIIFYIELTMESTGIPVLLLLYRLQVGPLPEEFITIYLLVIGAQRTLSTHSFIYRCSSHIRHYQQQQQRAIQTIEPASPICRTTLAHLPHHGYA